MAANYSRHIAAILSGFITVWIRMIRMLRVTFSSETDENCPWKMFSRFRQKTHQDIQNHLKMSRARICNRCVRRRPSLRCAAIASAQREIILYADDPHQIYEMKTLNCDSWLERSALSSTTKLLG